MEHPTPVTKQSIRRSIHHLVIHLCNGPPIQWFINQKIHQTIYPSIQKSIHLYIHPSIHQYICQIILYASSQLWWPKLQAQKLVEILHKGSMIFWSKSVKTRDCRLCMQERINLFYALNHPIDKYNTINSKSETYGTCSCKTRFLWLCTVGKEGADEAII